MNNQICDNNVNLSADKLAESTVLAHLRPLFPAELRACDPRSEAAEEKKVFFRFKNFLYKTVRIA